MKPYKGYTKRDASVTETRFLEQDEPAEELGWIPISLDWRNNVPSVMTPVKNQKDCGSCWAFAAVESIESAVAIKTGKEPPVLSPQQIVDCSTNPRHCGGTGGCEGSIP